MIFTAFNSHRGHEIERKNYLDDLKIGKWASQEQSESSGSNPGNSQFERRDSYQEWNDRRRPRYYRSRFSRSSNSDGRNWRNHRNGKLFHKASYLLVFWAFSHLHALIPSYTFIKFWKNYPPARLFHPTRLLIFQFYSLLVFKSSWFLSRLSCKTTIMQQ